MDHHKAAARKVKVTSPDERWWVNVWFRNDDDRIQIDLPAGRWVIEEAALPADGKTRLIFRRDLKA